MPNISRSSLLYLFAGCALVELLVVASTYVLSSPGEVSLNVSFDPPGGCAGEDSRYVDVTSFILATEDAISVRAAPTVIILDKCRGL